LQGYLLVESSGQRIDQAPTALVSDPRRPDRAVRNGLSCITCHTGGILDKADQVRDQVLNNRPAFRRADVAQVLTLYAEPELRRAQVQADAARFTAALARLGVAVGGPEPVAATVQHYEADLDLVRAAAEAGTTPEGLLRRLDRAPHLRRVLGPLQQPGGTVPRSVFVSVIAQVVETVPPPPPR
jgi:alkanesulfonate monooxygenase SsuD/methylene tetrahydromethanopterin reductase-like flavin-dependent oxidoreductase (luciferase family)